MATILIIGASRGIGRQTVKQALDAGYQVKALARSAKAIAINHPALTKIPADAQDDRVLTDVLKEVAPLIEPPIVVDFASADRTNAAIKDRRFRVHVSCYGTTRSADQTASFETAVHSKNSIVR